MPAFNPAMLTAARESRRVTQSDLATQIGVAQGTISKAENGVMPISDELVAGYARHLKYPVEFFVQSPSRTNLPITFYRKRKSVSAADLRAIEAQTLILKLQVARLLRSVEFPAPEVAPVDLRGSDLSAADVARELRMRWGLPNGPIQNLTKLLEDKGVIILRWSFDVPNVDGLSVYEPTDGIPPIVIVDPSFPGDRLRFTIAHELAHIILHHAQMLPDGSCEDDADEFASEFLMPAREIGPMLTRVTIDSLSQLKMFWKTSMASILKKAADLERISESQAAKLWATMSKLGYRKVEPYPLRPEESTLAKELATFHMQKLGYSLSQLSKATLANEDDFARCFMGEQRPRLRLVQNN